MELLHHVQRGGQQEYIMVGVCYRPPDQMKEEANEVFFKQLEEVSWLQSLVLMGNISHSNIFWKAIYWDTRNLDFWSVY